MLHARLGNLFPMFRGTVVPSSSKVQMSFTDLGYFDCWTSGNLRCLQNVGVRLPIRAASHPRRAKTNPISSSNTATYLPTYTHTYQPHLPTTHLPIQPSTYSYLLGLFHIAVSSWDYTGQDDRMINEWNAWKEQASPNLGYYLGSRGTGCANIQEKLKTERPGLIPGPSKYEARATTDQPQAGF